MRVEAITPAMSDVVLGFSIEEGAASDKATALETFEVAGSRIHPAADGLFAIGDTAHVFLQVENHQPH